MVISYSLLFGILASSGIAIVILHIIALVRIGLSFPMMCDFYRNYKNMKFYCVNGLDMYFTLETEKEVFYLNYYCPNETLDVALPLLPNEYHPYDSKYSSTYLVRNSDWITVFGYMDSRVINYIKRRYHKGAYDDPDFVKPYPEYKEELYRLRAAKERKEKIKSVIKNV
jgi:hypothetical protein